MTQSIAGVIGNMPDAKILIVLGNNHVLKKLDWLDNVLRKHRSIVEYLSELVLGISMYSIGQLIDENHDGCDFTRRFAHKDGSVVMDCDDSFHGWKIGIASALALKQTVPYELVDGVIVY
jgi:hypothetical protein